MTSQCSHPAPAPARTPFPARTRRSQNDHRTIPDSRGTARNGIRTVGAVGNGVGSGAVGQTAEGNRVKCRYSSLERTVLIGLSEEKSPIIACYRADRDQRCADVQSVMRWA